MRVAVKAHLFVLGVMGVCQQLLGLLAGRAHADQPQSDASSLARHSTVGVQDVLDLLERLLVIAAQGSQPKAQACPMLCNLQSMSRMLSDGDIWPKAPWTPDMTLLQPFVTTASLLKS